MSINTCVRICDLYDIEIGARLRACRKGQGIRAEALAEKADISPEHLRALESGREHPSIKTLFALADRLGVLPSALLSDDPPPLPSLPFPGIEALSPLRLLRLAQILQILLGEEADSVEMHVRFQQRRVALGWNVKQLSAAVGISYNQISQIERKKSRPSFSTFVLLLNALALRPEAFFRDTNRLCALAVLEDVYLRCRKTLHPREITAASKIIQDYIAALC